MKERIVARYIDKPFIQTKISKESLVFLKRTRNVSS